MPESISRKILRNMNLISDQEGIMQRYIREKENWDPHLEKTKQYIIDCLSGKSVSTLSVLGSGWLLDLPVDFLAEKFSEVYLYDIHHPKQITHKLKKFSTFKFITADITGGLLTQVYHAAKTYTRKKEKAPLEKLELQEFRPREESEFTISLNILNQLDILVIDYLKGFNLYSEEELNPLYDQLPPLPLLPLS